MTLHLFICILVGGLILGFRFGFLPGKEYFDEKTRRLFVLVALAGNMLGFLVTLQSADTSLPEDFRMTREEDAYDEIFMLSVDGAEPVRVTVDVPQLDQEKPPEDTQPDEEAEKRMAFDQMMAEYNLSLEDEEHYYLPSEWEGKRYVWTRPRDHSGELLAGLFLVGAAAVLILKGREQAGAEQKRREQLLYEYPEVIMKFTLLVQAGMNVRNAFYKMAGDYQKKKKEKKSLALEELLTACYELDAGMSEAEVYYRFGERCGQVRYKTWATLLVQNLQKGSRQLSELLEKESTEAWDERKRKARMLGEVASTKLLLPMILMLVVVMAVVMVPAFMGFYGQ